MGPVSKGGHHGHHPSTDPHGPRPGRSPASRGRVRRLPAVSRRRSRLLLRPRHRLRRRHRSRGDRAASPTTRPATSSPRSWRSSRQSGWAWLRSASAAASAGRPDPSPPWPGPRSLSCARRTTPPYAAGSNVASFVIDEPGPGVGEATLVLLNGLDLARYAPGLLLVAAVLAARRRLPRSVTDPGLGAARGHVRADDHLDRRAAHPGLARCHGGARPRRDSEGAVTRASRRSSALRDELGDRTPRYSGTDG